MDKTVPRGAAILLDFIYRTDAGKAPPECYGVIYANKQSKLPKPLTSMTLGEVVDAQKSWSKNYGSSAAGAAQFMRATLIDLSKELGLLGTQKFDADFQDRLAYHLLKRRGYEDYMAAKIDKVEFGRRLAMEWASLPVLADTQGAHRKLKRGQSYYAGDALNKSLVTPEKFEEVLMLARKAPDAPAVIPVPDQPKDYVEPEAPPSSSIWTLLLSILRGLVGRSN